MPVWVDFAEEIYGIPDFKGRGFKVAPDRHGPGVDPDSLERVPSAETIARSSTPARMTMPVRVRFSHSQSARPIPMPIPRITRRVSVYWTLSTRRFLLHLFGHLSYHLGQIDILRRVTTGAGAIALASL